MSLRPLSSDTQQAIADHVAHAREKHPWSQNMTYAPKFVVVEAELNEMAAAMLKGDTEAIKREAYDCIAVLVRIAEGE